MARGKSRNIKGRKKIMTSTRQYKLRKASLMGDPLFATTYQQHGQDWSNKDPKWRGDPTTSYRGEKYIA